MDDSVPNESAADERRADRGDARMAPYCTHCGTRNTADANYCKLCGGQLEKLVPLPVDPEKWEAQRDTEDRVGEMLSEAFRCRQRGDIASAILACNEALKLAPGSTSAHSLLGMLYDAQGDKALAISELEQVLKLNPGSIADREKLEELRTGATMAFPPHITIGHSVPSLRSNDRLASPVVLSVASFLVVCLVGGGVSYAVLRSDARADAASVARAAAAAATAAATAAARSPQVAAAPAQVGQSPAPALDPRYLNQPGPQRTSPGTPADSTPPRIIYRDTPRLPAYSPPGPASVTLNAVPRGSTGASGAQPINGGNGSRVDPRQPAGTDYGHIDIQVAPDSGSSTASSPNDPGSGMESRASQAIGRQAELQGNYRSAVKQYLKALDGAGDDAPAIEQHLGLCYQQLSEKESAVAHYSAAIKGYQEQIAAGRSVQSAKRGLQVCQTGIEANR